MIKNSIFNYGHNFTNIFFIYQYLISLNIYINYSIKIYKYNNNYILEIYHINFEYKYIKCNNIYLNV